jgi:hypothetical protein
MALYHNKYYSDAYIKYSNQPTFLGHYLLQNHYPEVPASLPA